MSFNFMGLLSGFRHLSQGRELFYNWPKVYYSGYDVKFFGRLLLLKYVSFRLEPPENRIPLAYSVLLIYPVDELFSGFTDPHCKRHTKLVMN